MQPTRLSSLLHCRTIFNLLLYIKKNTLPNLQVKVQNTSSSNKKQVQLQVEVKGVEERKVQLKSAIVVPTEVILPGEKENKTPFIDCHCHRGTLEEYFMKKKRPISPSFAGCVTVFCDPETFLKDEGVVQRILQEEGVHGSIGCHPKKAHLYSARVESYIIEKGEKCCRPGGDGSGLFGEKY